MLRTDLHGAAVQSLAPMFGRVVKSVDRNQFGDQLLAENTCGRAGFEPGDGPAAQRAVNMDRAAGDDLRTGGDRSR